MKYWFSKITLGFKSNTNFIKLKVSKAIKKIGLITINIKYPIIMKLSFFVEDFYSTNFMIDVDNLNN